MLPVGFETTISAGERAQTYVSDRAATGSGIAHYVQNVNQLPWQIYITKHNIIFIHGELPELIPSYNNES
jgi:hypothetical protein